MSSCRYLIQLAIMNILLNNNAFVASEYFRKKRL